MNITSLITKGYIYQDLFSEDSHARNGEFNILHLDRHGGFRAHKFSAFTESLGQVILHLWDGLDFQFHQSLMSLNSEIFSHNLQQWPHTKNLIKKSSNDLKIPKTQTMAIDCL
jgi:hypothetical protein